MGRIGQRRRRQARRARHARRSTRPHDVTSDAHASIDSVRAGRRRQPALPADARDPQSRQRASGSRCMKPTAILDQHRARRLRRRRRARRCAARRQLFAAALDVFNGEPAIDPRLLAAPRLVLAPHLGSATTEARTRWLSCAQMPCSRCSPDSAREPREPRGRAPWLRRSVLSSPARAHRRRRWCPCSPRSRRPACACARSTSAPSAAAAPASPIAMRRALLGEGAERKLRKELELSPPDAADRVRSARGARADGRARSGA